MVYEVMYGRLPPLGQVVSMKRRDSVRRSVDSALLAVERGDVDEGLATLRVTVDANPQDADVRIAQARAQLLAEDYAMVVATATVAVGLAPADHRGYYLRARAQEQRGKVDEALVDVHRAVKLSPGDFDSHVLLGRLELARRNFIRAADAAERAIALDRASPEGHALLADVAFETQQWDIVLVAARAVLRLRRNDRRATELLRMAQARLGAEPTTSGSGGPDLNVNMRVTYPSGGHTLPDRPHGWHADAAAVEEATSAAPVAARRRGSSDGIEKDGAELAPTATATARVRTPVSWILLAAVALLAAFALAIAVNSWWWLLLLFVPLALVVAVHRRRVSAAPEVPPERVRQLLARGMDDTALAGNANDGKDIQGSPDVAVGSPISQSRSETPADGIRSSSRVSVEQDAEGLAVEYTESASGGDGGAMGVDGLLAAAEQAINTEQWSAAEAHLRRVLELEPLYLNAHERLMFVLQQQPRWVRRR